MHSSDKRCWVEIDLNAVKHNYDVIRTKVSSDIKLCCVVKADAYGHGVKVLSKFYENLDVDYFAVSNINEAIELRENGITKPVLVLGYTNPECANLLGEHNIEQTVFSREYAENLNYFAEKSDVKIKIHIKIDTGMGRVGFVSKDSDSMNDAKYACYLKNLIPYGVFTHFAVAERANPTLTI